MSVSSMVGETGHSQQRVTTMLTTVQERYAVRQQHDDFIGIYHSENHTEDAVWHSKGDDFAESGPLMSTHRIMILDADVSHSIEPLHALQGLIKAVADKDAASIQHAFANFLEVAAQHGIMGSWLQRLLGDVFMTGRMSQS